MKHFFILNPTAGKNYSVDDLAARINAAAVKTGSSVEIYITKAQVDARNFVKYMCELHDEDLRFYSCGGDGTLHEVCNGAYGYKNASIGCIPFGSGNDYIKSINSDYFKDIEKQLTADTTRVDLIKVNDKFCLNTVNVGFDANIAHRMKTFKSLPFISGNTAYSLSLLFCLMSRLGITVEVEIDGKVLKTKNFLLTAMGKGQYYGGHFNALPRANPDDGFIDVCTVRRVSRFTILNFSNVYEKGEHIEKLSDFVDYYKAKHVRIRSQRQLKVGIDGEIYMMSNPDFKIMPKAMRFITP